jgi:hypothetical protein
MRSTEDITCCPCQKPSYWPWRLLPHCFRGRVWLHAQVLLLGAIRAPGAHTVTTALRALGLARERRFTNHAQRGHLTKRTLKYANENRTVPDKRLRS